MYNYVNVALKGIYIYIITKRIKRKRNIFIVTNNNSRIHFDVTVTLYM